MARTKRTNNMVSPELLSAVKQACRDLLSETTDHTTCVSASKIAHHKAVAKGFTVTNTNALRPFVLAAVEQMHGFETRVGKNGGVHRVKTTRNRQPRAAAPTPQPQPQPQPQQATAEAPDAPANDTAQEAANA